MAVPMAKGGTRSKGGQGLLTGMVGALALFAPPHVAAQQARNASVHWSLRGLQEGICVDFLVSPTIAAERVGGAGTPVPAESLETAFPALAREVRSEPQYQGWVPAEYCWFLYASGSVGGKEFHVEGGKQPVMVGFVSLAARDLPGGTTGYAVHFFSNAPQLITPASNARLRVDRIRFTRSPIPDQEELADHYRFEATHGQAVVQWDGGPGTATTVMPRSVALTGLAIASGDHFAHATISPDSAFTPSGNLRVLGNGELQEMLSASPIRLVTTLIRGGDTEWVLDQ